MKLEKLENSSIGKAIKKERYYTIDMFIRDAKEYIKAIKDGRMIVNIASVSRSGMSRQMKFLSCEKGVNKYYYRNYFVFFRVTGHTTLADSGNIRVFGCGMDMVFHTNYTIIHRLHRLGFINKKQCDSLAQLTPAVI